MSLTARERILKLREAEFKLHKLQHDLLTVENDDGKDVSDFLNHHKELMSLPGSNRNSLPFRFEFETQQRYVQLEKPQKLTLPPKIDAKSVNRLKPYREPVDESEKIIVRNAEGLAKHPSLALHTFLKEINQQNSKMAVNMPKVDKFSLSNPSKFSRNIQPLNSNRYLKSTSGPGTSNRKKGSSKSLTNNNTSSTSLLFIRAKQTSTNSKTDNINKPGTSAIVKKEVIERTNKKDDLVEPVSKIASATTSALLTKGSANNSKLSIPPRNNHTAATTAETPKSDGHPKSRESKLRNDLAYALGTANLMGVILPPHPAARRKLRGPSWNNLRPSNHDGIDSDMTAKEALNLLRKRKLPERKYSKYSAPPHERGLVGVEITEFLPQCSFFYRDRSGNYNPHLHHSKTITESMKKVPQSSSIIQRLSSKMV